ncbi:MAG: 4-(cytidine 5'-diphospho)-2-C-methyl-D-erythritol kinase, partial [Desulfobulbaceae bacterium]|nr:4-(cytidine 5'-diphospho)-2-C-methyl-D-erythritol kinase [Desulfobulbaceae bacterium]
MRNLKRITVKAPAKVNLYLEVTGRRADGYHDLLSFMQKLELADTIMVTLDEEGSGVEMSANVEGLPLDDGNLAVRAAHAFLRETGLSGGVIIDLDKRIPIAAGLGGGSSDAAAVLTALNGMTGLPLNSDRLQATALALGADVPFLVSDFAAAWATGVGEKLRAAAPLADCHVLLVNPGFPVSTKWVFETYGEQVAGR